MSPEQPTLYELCGKIQNAVEFEFDEIDGDLPALEIPCGQLIKVLTILKYNRGLAYQNLTDIIVVDRPDDERRFELNYLLASINFVQRLNIRIKLDDDEAVDSIISIYPAAHFRECEIWEFFGINFTNNHNINHLILPDGYDGFPLRKDFEFTA